MPIVKSQIRQGAYYDSVVLMQLQKSLIAVPGVLDAGVVMGTEANKDLLAQNDLLAPDGKAAHSEDLLIAVSAHDESAAASALAQVDELLNRKRGGVDAAYHPKSIDSAIQSRPDAQWVMISVPGRFAASVTRDALSANRHVFLYSDNVSLEGEITLKQSAREKRLLLMGPDCGTAIVNGVGLGFANCVRRGGVGIIGASGTGMQAVSVGVHRLGAGISQALGTGSNDLKDAVGATTTLQALDFLARDDATRVIVLISKPPSPGVAATVLAAARRAGKPVVVDFIGYVAVNEANLHFARTLDDAAYIAAMLGEGKGAVISPRVDQPDSADASSGLSQQGSAPATSGRAARFLRGLYSGGTLAYEAQLILRDYLPAIYSNSPLPNNHQLSNPHTSQENTIVDLGSEEFMVGRLHPMIDNDLRLRRLKQEADDPSVAVILLDVVLGYGAHPDPASELAPAISDARVRAARSGRMLEFVAVVLGTDEDPQNYTAQVERMRAAGARVMVTHEAAVRHVGQMVGSYKQFASPQTPLATQSEPIPFQPINPAAFNDPFAAINVGIESFSDSLKSQNAPVVQVDWKPPAGGNEKLMSILERLKQQQ